MYGLLVQILQSIRNDPEKLQELISKSLSMNAELADEKWRRALLGFGIEFDAHNTNTEALAHCFRPAPILADSDRNANTRLNG